MTGVLYLVGTPIGNLEDITFRAVRILKEVDYIYCEDTRVTRTLTMHYNIDTPLKSYHEHNKDKVTDQLIETLVSGNHIALVSDAGLPLISDPGYELVVECRDKGIRIETIPGPNAALSALMTSGIASYSFIFDGFLPRKDKEKKKRLQTLMELPHTAIIYESPFRVKHTIEIIMEIDATREVAIARELTKKFEQVETANVREIYNKLDNEINLKGEFVIIIDAVNEADKVHWWTELTVYEHVIHYIETGMQSKEAIKQTAVDRNMKKNEVYDIYHIEH